MSLFSHAVSRGISRLRRLGPKPAQEGLRIFTYHSVGGRFAKDPYGTNISPGRFRAHMEYLLQRQQAVLPLSSPSTIKTAVALTFDDGYHDTLTVAAPILHELGLPMTLFVTTRFLHNTGRLYLNSEQLKVLAAQPGVTIGAHGHSHTPMDALSDAALKEELFTSRNILENLLARPVTMISYPHGRVDRRVRDAAEAAGYTLGACSRYGLNTAHHDPLLLCRTEVTRWDGVRDLSLKVKGYWDWFSRRQPDPAIITV